MILGILKETQENETRVAAIPATVKQYVAAGFSVKVESGAGAESHKSLMMTSKKQAQRLYPMQHLYTALVIWF